MFNEISAFWREFSLEPTLYFHDARTAERALHPVGAVRLQALSEDGTPGDDDIVGTREADQIYALGGNDRVAGRGGDDHIEGGGGKDRLKGGAGDDRIKGQQNRDVIDAGAGNDNASGGLGTDWIDGASGNDTLSGNQGKDTLLGGDGNDHIRGGREKDRISLDPGDDVIIGKTASFHDGWDGEFDYLFADQDYGDVALTIDLRVDGAQDTGLGNDRIVGIEGIVGGHADDRLIGDGNDNVFNGLGGKDFLSGGRGDDILFGDRGSDTLRGGGGVDLIKGHSGDDILRGGAGDDFLDGGSSADTLTGGAGDDTFVFYRGVGGKTVSNRDVVTDFTRGDDILVFSDFAPTFSDDYPEIVFSGTTEAAYSVWYSAVSDGVLVKVDANGDAVFDYKVKLRGLTEIGAEDLVFEDFYLQRDDLEPFKDQGVWQGTHSGLLD